MPSLGGRLPKKDSSLYKKYITDINHYMRQLRNIKANLKEGLKTSVSEWYEDNDPKDLIRIQKLNRRKISPKQKALAKLKKQLAI